MKLVIVESPAKAETINRYLGEDYKVVASVGHIRNLIRKQGSFNQNLILKCYGKRIKIKIRFLKK